MKPVKQLLVRHYEVQLTPKLSLSKEGDGPVKTVEEPRVFVVPAHSWRVSPSGAALFEREGRVFAAYNRNEWRTVIEVTYQEPQMPTQQEVEAAIANRMHEEAPAESLNGSGQGEVPFDNLDRIAEE